MPASPLLSCTMIFFFLLWVLEAFGRNGRNVSYQRDEQETERGRQRTGRTMS